MLLYDCQQISLNQQNIKFGFYIKSTKIISVVKFNIKQIFNTFLKQTNWQYKSMYRYVKKETYYYNNCFHYFPATTYNRRLKRFMILVL